MSSGTLLRVLPPVILLVFGACRNASDDRRLAQLEARVAKLERGAEPHRASELSSRGAPTPAPPATTLAVAEPPSAATSVVAAPTEADAEPVIQQHCTSKWPTDFQMQAYCKKQQREAVVKLNAVPPSDIPNDAFVTLRHHCEQKWPSDFQMREYCERQQIDGYRESR